MSIGNSSCFSARDCASCVSSTSCAFCVSGNDVRACFDRERHPTFCAVQHSSFHVLTAVCDRTRRTSNKESCPVVSEAACRNLNCGPSHGLSVSQHSQCCTLELLPWLRGQSSSTWPQNETRDEMARFTRADVLLKAALARSWLIQSQSSANQKNASAAAPAGLALNATVLEAAYLRYYAHKFASRRPSSRGGTVDLPRLRLEMVRFALQHIPLMLSYLAVQRPCVQCPRALACHCAVQRPLPFGACGGLPVARHADCHLRRF